jgi:predicted dehydrogenase
MKEHSPQAGADSRRDFIKKAATAAAVVASSKFFKTPVYGQTTAPSTGRVLGANDRIAVGYIGIGGKPSNSPGMGRAHVTSQKKHASENNITQAAVCDLWTVRNEVAKSDIGTSDVTAYDDYRKLLARKDIDAVVVATHDPWHARCAIDAMESGKHVYCEKPMTRYLEEAFQVHDAVKRTGRIFQAGSQGCSAGAWHKAAELIRAGKIGKLVWGQGYYCRNNSKGEWNYSIDSGATPETLNWNAWLGPVHKKIPFNPDHYFRWRKYLPYCAGLFGDLVPHRLHPLMLATGNPEFPKRVVSIGTKSVHTDRNTPGTPERDVAEHLELIAEFPSGLTLVVASSTVNARSPGFVIYGHQATLEIGDQGNVLQMIPEREFAKEFEGLTESENKEMAIEPIKGLQVEDVAVHEKNWFDSIRANKQPNASIDLAVRVQTIISLAEMSDRLGIMCHFDEKTRKVKTGDGKEIKPLTYGSLDLS